MAYTLPYRRFADVLADACARIGGDVDCYSFTAVDFHHILLASLPAHLLALRPAHSHGHLCRDRYPKASDTSSPPCLLRSLPAGAVAGWGLHPLEKRRLVTAHADSGPSRSCVADDVSRRKRTFAHRRRGSRRGGGWRSFLGQAGPAQADIDGFLAERRVLRRRVPIGNIGTQLGQ
jgi:hypothetical protein